MAIEQNDRDTSSLDAKTDVGPATGYAYDQHGVETGRFDREIGVKLVLWSGVALVVTALVVHFLIWGLLRGFDKMDDRRDVPLTPIEAATPQPEDFPLPRLQTLPEQDLRLIREEEDRLLHQAGWVDPRQGTVRVPIDVAIDVIAARGVEPGVVGGSPAGAAAANPDQVRQQGLDNPAGRQPGATVQMTRPATPARPPASGADNQE